MELGIARDRVKDEFDSIELKLLEQFYMFIRDRRDKYWIHWNMRNLTYGFEHLEHRYRVLGHSDAPIIPVEQRINLNDMLSDRYGDDYASHPRLPALMKMNGGIHRHFLSGEEEVQAFKNNEFIRMHNSTLAKVGFFAKVIDRLLKGTLHPASKGWGVTLDKLFESRLAKSVGFFGTLLGIALGFLQLWQTFYPPTSTAVSPIATGQPLKVEAKPSHAPQQRP